MNNPVCFSCLVIFILDVYEQEFRLFHYLIWHILLQYCSRRLSQAYSKDAIISHCTTVNTKQTIHTSGHTAWLSYPNKYGLFSFSTRMSTDGKLCLGLEFDSLSSNMLSGHCTASILFFTIYRPFDKSLQLLISFQSRCSAELCLYVLNQYAF